MEQKEKRRDLKVYIRFLPSMHICRENIKYNLETNTIYMRCRDAITKRIGQNARSPQFWNFHPNKVFYNASQENIYDVVTKGMLENSIKNRTDAVVVSFGQVGSGKTFTMTGIRSKFYQRGLVPRFMSQILQSRKRNDLKVACDISFVEISGQEVTDLFTGKRLKLEDMRRVPTIPLVSGHCSLERLFQAESRRKMADDVNFGHRGHGIVTFHVRTLDLLASNAEYQLVKIHFVDLAGVDSFGKTPDSGKKAKDIGKSNVTKSFFDQCICRLEKPPMQVVSDLAIRFLGNSLSEDSMLRFIGHVKMSKPDLAVSLSILRFSARIAGTKVDKTTPDPSTTHHRKPETLKSISARIQLDAMLKNYSDPQGLVKRVCKERVAELRSKAQNYLERDFEVDFLAKKLEDTKNRQNAIANRKVESLDVYDPPIPKDFDFEKDPMFNYLSASQDLFSTQHGSRSQLKSQNDLLKQLESRTKIGSRMNFGPRAVTGPRAVPGPRAVTGSRSKIPSRLRVDSRLKTNSRPRVDSRMKSDSRPQVDSRLKTNSRSRVDPRLKTDSRARMDPRLKTESRSRVESRLRFESTSQPPPLENRYKTGSLLQSVVSLNVAKEIAAQLDTDIKPFKTELLQLFENKLDREKHISDIHVIPPSISKSSGTATTKRMKLKGPTSQNNVRKTTSKKKNKPILSSSAVIAKGRGNGRNPPIIRQEKPSPPLRDIDEQGVSIGPAASTPFQGRIAVLTKRARAAEINRHAVIKSRVEATPTSSPPVINDDGDISETVMRRQINPTVPATSQESILKEEEVLVNKLQQRMLDDAKKEAAQRRSEYFEANRRMQWCHYQWVRANSDLQEVQERRHSMGGENYDNEGHVVTNSRETRLAEFLKYKRQEFYEIQKDLLKRRDALNRAMSHLDQAQKNSVVARNETDICRPDLSELIVEEDLEDPNDEYPQKLRLYNKLQKQY